MNFEMLLIGVGLAFLVWLWAFTYQLMNSRTRTRTVDTKRVIPVNLLNNKDAVIVAEGRGHLVYMNDRAREWFNLNGGDPNLSVLAAHIQPEDLFHDLFADEGRATLRLGLRRIEAVSHIIPTTEGRRTVVVLREIETEIEEDQFDTSSALMVVQEISQTITSSIDLNQTMNTILNSVGRVIRYDAGEITLWDQSLNALRPVGRVGDTRRSGANGGSSSPTYGTDEGYTGWIARYRQPLLLGDVSVRSDVRPHREDFPFQSYIGLPLTVNDRFIGTLELASNTRYAFDHEDLALLESIAGQAAIAIENARLATAQANRLVQMTGLQSIAQTMSDQTDPRDLFRELHERIAGLMQVEICGLLLYDAETETLVSQLPFHGAADSVISLHNIPVPQGSVAEKLWREEPWWYSNDVLRDEMVAPLNMRGLAEVIGIRTAALMPMSIGNNRIGMVQVANRRDGSGFSEDDMRLLSIFAAQAAIVVENANLYERERRYIAELANLQQMTEVARSSDTTGFFAQVTERIAGLMQVEMCGVLLWDENGTDDSPGVLVAQPPFHGIDEESIRFYQLPVAEGSMFERLHVDKDYWLSNDLGLEDWPGALNFAQLAGMVGMKKVLMAPLSIGEQRLGIIQVANKHNSHDFTADDGRVLSISAKQASVLIDNVRLYRDVQRLSNETESLRLIAEKVAGHLTLDEVLADALEDVTRLLDSEIVALGLLDAKTGNLAYNRSAVFGGTLEHDFNIDIYSGRYSHIPVMSRSSLRSLDVEQADPIKSAYGDLIAALGIKNLLVVPLIINQRSLGEVIVANKRYGVYDDSDEQLLLTVAAQLAAAVERTRLYASTDADLRARVEEQEALDRISRALNETLLLDRILEVIRGEAMRTTHADDVSVVLFSPASEWGDPNVPEIEIRLGAQELFGTGLAMVEQHMVDTNDLVLVEDYMGSDLSPMPDTARSAIVQPIHFGEEIVGSIHLFTQEAHRFNEATVFFINRLGQQASLAVSNARRFQDQLRANERLRRRAHQVQQIFTLSNMLREGASLAELMQEVAYAISETVGFDKVSIRTLDEQEQVFRMVAQAGLPLQVFEEVSKRVRPYEEVRRLMHDRWKVSNSYFFPAEYRDEWQHPELNLIDDHEVVHTTGAGPRNWNPDDLLIVPILNASGDMIGTVSVDDPYDGRRPDPETIELLEVFASQAAFITENFRLVENVQEEAEAARRERDRLAQLHLVSSEIQRAADMPSRLQAVADGVVAAGWRRVQITLRDEFLEPTLMISSGYTDEEVQRIQTKLLPGKIWQDRFKDLEFHELKLGGAYYLRYDSPWVRKNILRGEVPHPSNVPDDEWHPQDVLYLPLVGHDQKRIIGLIRMEDPVDGRRPTEDSLQPIELFALQAAAAIDNTRLYSQTMQQAQTEQRLNELMEAMASTLDQTEIIRALAAGLQPFVIFTRMHLVLPAENQDEHFEMTRVELTPDGKVHIFPDNPLSIAHTALGQVFQAGESKIFDLTVPQDRPDLQTWSAEGERAVLMVPMIAGGDTLGVLRLGSELDQSFSFTEQQSLNLIERMANLSAVSIQNSRLFTSLDGSRSFNQAVVQSIQQGIVVLDGQANIQLINAYMVNHYGWESDAVGRNLFAYRPEFRDFLENSIQEAIATGEELHQFDIQDVDSDGQLLIRNFYTYPLRQGDRVTGVVLLVEDITQRALLEADLSNRAEQLAALTAVSSQMTETLQPDQVIEVVLDALDTVIPYDGVALWLVDPDDATMLSIVAARGFEDPDAASVEELIDLRVDIEDSVLFREMAAQQEVVNVGTTANDPRFPFGEGRVYKNFLAAPLISKGEIIGVLQLEKKQPLFYGAHHEQLVLAFANQAAVALNNANLFTEAAERAEQLNRQTERLTLVNRVSVSLGQSLDIENVLEITLRETAIALGVRRGVAIQITPEDNICRVMIEYPRGDEEPSLSFNLSDSLVMKRLRDTLLPLAIDDVNQSPMRDDLHELMECPDVASALFVPLVVSGSVIGVMRFDVVGEKQRFTNEHIDLAQILASQAAIAVQNASLFQQSLQRTYQLETLFEAGQATAGALDVADVMRRVATQMLIALRADMTEIMHRDQVENKLVVEATKTSLLDEAAEISSRGNTYDMESFKLRERVLNDRRALPLRIDSEDLDPQERQQMEERGVFSRLLVPLVINEVAIGLGVIDVHERSRYFDHGQVRLASTLANQAAVAIENARLQSETRTQIEELYLINDLSKAVSSTVVLNELLNQVRMQLPMLTDAGYLYLALYDEDAEQLTFAVAMSEAGEEVDMPPYKPEPQDEFGYVLNRQSPLLLAGGSLEQVRSNMGITKPLFPDAKCFLAVPMIVGEQFIGVLALRDDEDARKFAFNDQRILTTVTAQLGVAIQNANLFAQIRDFAQGMEERVADRTRELEQERQRLSILYDIASEIAAATLDLDRVLNRTLDAVSQAINATTAIVLAIDDISDQLYPISHRGLEVSDESERLQLRQNEGLAGWIIQNRQGVVIPDVQKDPRWISISDRDKRPRSAVATLLESGDDVRGVIMFYNEEPHVFNEDHLRLVTAVASQLANSMSNAELYSLIRDQAERLGAILRQEQVESTKNTAILNSVADGVMYANEKGIIRVFNNTAEHVLGLASDQVLNRHIREVTGFYGGRASGWMDAIETWMDDPTQHQSGEFVEELLRLEDERVISVRLSPVMMGDQFLGTVSVFRDITREVEVDRLKSDFVATVSHELRTPMTSIKGYADLLLLGAAGEMSEAQQRFLQTIKQNADRLSILVNDLLEVSRIDQGRMPLRFTPVDVSEVIQTVCAHLSGRIKDSNKPMQITVEGGGDDLPPVRADFDKIIQVMQNLADNAFNYTPENGTITLSSQHMPEDNTVIMTVRDTGIGIPEAVHHRVFERFFRGDEYSEVVMDTPGTGLGLAIVKELVTMHKGTIGFNSVVNEGTTFYVKLPVFVEDDEVQVES